MKKIYYILSVFCFLMLPLQLHAQEWVRNLEKADKNFFEVQREFEAYWQNREQEKGKGYKQFKRWEWYWQQRVSPEGVFPDPSLLYQEWQQYQFTEARLALRRTAVAKWTPLGPSHSESGYGGIGRINCMAVHPTQANTYWVGTAGGGLWKTTTGGNSWTTTTDDLPVLGVTSIIVNPVNPDVLYIATGDGINNTNSEGVMKSVDGGATWTKTSLSFKYEEKARISSLIMHPTNPKVLLAASNKGLFKTTNSGESWQKVQDGVFTDLKFSLADPAVVFACTRVTPGVYAQVFRSADSGSSWEKVSNFSNLHRIALAVTPAAPNMVRAVGCGANSGFGGLFTSSDNGLTFEITYDKDSINLLHSSYNGVGAGGQGWYDLAITISPVDSNLLFVGGINTWKSEDGGKNWKLATMWWADSRVPDVAVVHADKHFLMYHPNKQNTLFECNDGGIYRSANNGVTWQDISSNLEITQFYRVGVSAGNSALLLAGAQDNGTKLRNGIGWRDVTGGDGTNCLIDYSDDKIMYSAYQNGGIYRTMDAFTNPATLISRNIPGTPTGAWITPYTLDPVQPNILYAGYKDVFKSTDRGDTWQAISTNLSTVNLTFLVVAPSNPQVIYTGATATGNVKSKIFKTADGGTTWSEITGSLPISSANISNISVNPVNPQHVVATFSGFSDGHKVYSSEDGGATWTNISGALPNIPVNCSVFRDGTSHEIYVGTDLGVFYKDKTTDWQPFNDGLPNIVINDLKIHFNENKLLAATFGRGIWVTALTPPNAPVILTISPANAKVGETITISGSNLAGATQVIFNDAPATPSFVSATTITVAVPAGARTGPVSVVTPAGTVISKDEYNISTVTGLAAENGNSKVEVYPNPTSDKIRVGFHAVPVKEITFFSELGSVVKTVLVTQDEMEVSVAEMPSGIYFIKFTSANGSHFMRRFVKL